MNPLVVVTPFGDDKILSFDLELTRDEKLRHLGALLAERELNLKGPQELSIKALNALAQDADLILGHNILDFDLPWLHNCFSISRSSIPSIYRLSLFPRIPIIAW